MSSNESAAKKPPDFQQLRVLALESRRATEMASLITHFGGTPIVAPALREVPLESNTEALEFAEALMLGGFDLTIFLTGVGTRTLVSAIERVHRRETVIAALSRTKVAARGPKPLGALRELGVPVWVTAPEPNTWRELLAAIDARAKEDAVQLAGSRIAVQEYGASSVDLLRELAARGAHVTSVPVYRYALPEDVQPLKDAISAIARGEIDVLVLTTGVQLVHLWQLAETMGAIADVRRELARMVIASIGPTTTEELHRHELDADLEASHPKMGLLITEAALKSGGLLRVKRR